MKSEERWLESLSAALDAQPGAPEPDAEGRARMEAYRRMGNLLRELPDPEIHAAFVTRVMAHAAEAQPAPRRWAWRWAGGAAALAVAAVALYAGLRPEPASVPAEPQFALREDLSQEEQVVDKMATMLDEGVVLEIGGLEEEEVLAEHSALPEGWTQQLAEEAYAALADDYWLSPEAPLAGETPGYLPEYDDLNAAERQTMEEILAVYREQV